MEFSCISNSVDSPYSSSVAPLLIKGFLRRCVTGELPQTCRSGTCVSTSSASQKGYTPFSSTGSTSSTGGSAGSVGSTGGVGNQVVRSTGTPDSCFKCQARYFSLTTDDTSCHICPPNAVCNGGSHIEAKPGYWQQPDDPTVMYRCRAPDACLGNGSATKLWCNETLGYQNVCEDAR